MHTILVTGGNGFIGSHTCVSLLQKGYKVIIVDSLVNSDIKTISNIKSLILSNKNHLSFIHCDIRNEVELDKIFSNAIIKNDPISGVIHFAGLKSVSDSVKSPLSYWENNLFGSITLLKIMQKYNCRKIIFSSSASIYEFSEESHLKEESNIKPINPYGNTKATIEKVLSDVFNSEKGKWKIANLRYFNPIGANPLGGLNENYSGNPTNIFPLILLVAAKKKEKLVVYGDNWPTPDGTGVRDYIHVMDLAEGHVAAFEYLVNNESQIINLNLGNGKGVSVLELIRKFEEVNNLAIPYVISDPRPGDLARTVSDNQLALSLLDWNPSLTLSDMCRDGWTSFQKEILQT